MPATESLQDCKWLMLNQVVLHEPKLFFRYTNCRGRAIMIGVPNLRCPTYIKLMKPDHPKIRIAVVEDNELYNHLLTTGLKNHINSLSYDVKLEIIIDSYTNAKIAFSEINEHFDIVFLDYYLGDSITGLDILKRIKKLNPECKVIILSQIKDSKTSVDTLDAGANDFIYKDPSAIATSCIKAANMIYQKLGHA